MAGAEQFSLMLKILGVFIAAVGLPCLALARFHKRPLWADAPDPPVRWGGSEVLLLVLLFVIVPLFVGVLLDALGFFKAVYDENPPTAFKSLWAQVIAAVPFVALGLLMLHRLTGTLPPEVGLRGRPAGPYVLRAGLAFAALTPVVLGVNLAANLVSEAATGVKPEQHSLKEAAAQFGSTEVALFWVTVCVTAPLTEEFLFRGVLLRLLRTDRIACHFCYAAAVGWAVFRSQDNPSGPLPPITFGVALLPLYAFFCRDPDSNRPAMLSAGLLFGMIHPAWPTPVALTLLGYGLAWVAIRSGSLVPCVIAHGLFNAVSAAFILLSRNG